MQKSNYVKKFAVISGQFLMACCLILLSTKVSYADVSSQPRRRRQQHRFDAGS